MKRYSWRVTPESAAGGSHDSTTRALPGAAVKVVGVDTGAMTVELFATAGTPPWPVVKEAASLPAASWMTAASSPVVGSV